ncbi:MAG TPA: hypothetical protein VFT59_01685, partial [Candidatus Saccharimonadales bacterium]|nr:hypothetical protein [Candidatus Saccharimonadales bacterium]
MRNWLVAGVAVIVLAGCSATDTSAKSLPTTKPSSITEIVTVTATVNTKQFELAPIWIPVQLDPEFREGHGITLPDEWPTHGTKVDVRCWTDEGEYL